MSVGVMKDEKLKLRELHAGDIQSHIHCVQSDRGD